MMRLVRAIVRPSQSMRLVAGLAALTLLVLLFVLGILSAGRGWLPGNSDKLVHFVYYGSLAGLFWIALGGRGAALWLAVLLASGIGVMDELVQSVTPGRDPSVMDWFADVAGAVTVVGTLQVLRHLTGRGAPPQLDAR
jgi:VanZ family protein